MQQKHDENPNHFTSIADALGSRGSNEWAGLGGDSANGGGRQNYYTLSRQTQHQSWTSASNLCCNGYIAFDAIAANPSISSLGMGLDIPSTHPSSSSVSSAWLEDGDLWWKGLSSEPMPYEVSSGPTPSIGEPGSSISTAEDTPTLSQGEWSLPTSTLSSTPTAEGFKLGPMFSYESEFPAEPLIMSPDEIVLSPEQAFQSFEADIKEVNPQRKAPPAKRERVMKKPVGRRRRDSKHSRADSGVEVVSEL